MQPTQAETKLPSRLIFWEEVARDGAQAKTLMSAEQRIDIARRSAEILNNAQGDNLIFAAGFPAICTEEREIMRQLADTLDDIWLSSHGRASQADLQLGKDSLAGAKKQRLTFFIPMSIGIANAFGFPDMRASLANGTDALKFALDIADGAKVDIALADINQVDPAELADITTGLLEAGADIIKLCDSRGAFSPLEAERFYQTFFGALAPEVDRQRIGVHQHNDYGFGLMNDIIAIKHGAGVVASSWLGLGERNGLAKTEELVFALSETGTDLADRYGVTRPIWAARPNLKGIPGVTQAVSQYTGVPIKVTDAIVGLGVNSISTGTPFRNPKVFQPFDAEGELGIEQKVYVTPLASMNIVRHMCDRLGLHLEREEMHDLLHSIKSTLYGRNQGVMTAEEFRALANASMRLEPELKVGR